MKRFFLVIMMVLGCAANVFGADVPKAKKTILDNGLVLLVNEMPSCEIAEVRVFVRTGSANEGKYLGSGITHFIEHMLFKGTDRRPTGAIPDEARRLGGNINASTGKDHTEYHISLPKGNTAQAIDLLADMLRHPRLDAVEADREREVILKEIRMLHDKPERYLDDLLDQTTYIIHPYRMPIIGTEPLLRALTRDDLVAYYQAYYIPGNMIISVAGGVKSDEVLKAVKAGFGDGAAKITPVRDLPQEPQQIIPRQRIEEYPTPLVRIVMAYQGVPLLDKDLFALDVLAMALGQGESSRLIQRLYKDKRLVEAVYASNPTPVDRGTFEIGATLNKDDTEEFITQVKALIAEISRKGLTPEELEKVKRQVEASRVYGRQTAEGMAAQAAFDEAFTGDPEFSTKYIQAVRAVTNEDIRKVASTYLTEGRLSIVVLKPKIETAVALSGAPAPAATMQRVSMPNGMTLLLKEDKTLPLVSICVLVRAGMAQDPEEFQGLSALMGRLWSQGISGKAPDEISRAFETRAAGVSSSAGFHYISLSMQALEADIPFLLEHLKEFLHKPSFPQKELDRDRKDLLTVLERRKDSIAQTSLHAFMETLFLTYPFNSDGIGTKETLDRIDREKVTSFFTEFFVPNNTVISVVGAIDVPRMRSYLEQTFGGLKKRGVSFIKHEEAFPTVPREKALEMDKDQAMVLMGFRAPTLDSKEREAVELAVNVLSSPLGGRIYKRVREELGKAYTLGGSYSPGKEAGVVSFYVLTTNENIDKVRSIIKEEIVRLAREPLSPQELADAKACLKGERASDLQTIAAQAAVSAMDELMGLGYDHYQGYNGRIDAVSVENIRAVAATYLDMGKATLVVTRSSRSPGVKQE